MRPPALATSAAPSWKAMTVPRLVMPAMRWSTDDNGRVGAASWRPAIDASLSGRSVCSSRMSRLLARGGWVVSARVRVWLVGGLGCRRATIPRQQLIYASGDLVPDVILVL